MHIPLRTIDLVLVVLYLLGITWFGLRFRRQGERSIKSYFLADRNIPWWAICLSIVAAETSTLTIISVPGIAFTGDFGFLQLAMGYLLGRVVICIIFLPRYFRGELMTAYQLIGQRFGTRLHRLTALLFLVMRAAAEGVRVFAVAIVVGVALGTGDIASIVILSLLTLLYTFEGGMKAVIWTDVLQMLLYFLGTLVSLWSICAHIHGGAHALLHVASSAGKLTIFHFSLSITETYTFWAGVLGGCFLTMASHGTDQLMVQRLLAAKNLYESRLALLTSGVVIFVQFTLFLLIGAGLYVFYGQTGRAPHVASADRLFPHYIVWQMPMGVSGLMIAAILAAAMSNLSAALNSLASTSMVDLYLLRRPDVSEESKTRLSRVMTMGWAAVLLILAIVSRGSGHVLEIGLSIASVLWGGMLGVFLLGTLTRRAKETATMIGLLAGCVLNVLLWRQSSEIHWSLLGHSFVLPKVAWTWYVAIGAAITFGMGYLLSLFGKRNSVRSEL
ncbi:sodium:solute symporter [Alloacidobacterium sp.]|uniref:sodium:solute symporter n=1 Tax=Alloacidobacterium sp. TaxID=2951999 RepID=UPI002D240D32|nr:sodium:solute symporter [Alloacidobacterium sp.]HYK34475.1 sodium:solute symporter [Alloacidobacterium sp.]